MKNTEVITIEFIPITFDISPLAKDPCPRHYTGDTSLVCRCEGIAKLKAQGYVHPEVTPDTIPVVGPFETPIPGKRDEEFAHLQESNLDVILNAFNMPSDVLDDAHQELLDKHFTVKDVLDAVVTNVAHERALEQPYGRTERR